MGMTKSLDDRTRLLDMITAGPVYSIILALLFAVAAGLMGNFALMKRMTLTAELVPQVALPGVPSSLQDERMGMPF